jgi:hypothetical protein
VRSEPLHIAECGPCGIFLVRGLTILLVTFAALLVMRGAQQPHFALLATAPMPAVNVP